MKYFILIATIILSCAPATLFAASFELGQPLSTVAEGDTVRVPVYVDAESELAVIVDARIQFPRELLWAKSFMVAPGWLAVPGAEYNYIDNGRGAAHATAGFEGGISEQALFGTLEFIVISAGVAEVRVLDDSLISNVENGDILAEEKMAIAVIEISALGSAGSVPPRLFDIGLKLASDKIKIPEPLIAHVVFQSFGAVPTPVDIFFLVTDKTGKILASSEESLVVETEAVFTKEFEDLALPPGNYTFHAHTRYNTDVEDDFYASFSVRSKFSWWWVVSGTMAALVAAILLLFIINRQSQKHGNGTKK